jgi:hypothetical protein
MKVILRVERSTYVTCKVLSISFNTIHILIYRLKCLTVIKITRNTTQNYLKY